VAADVRAALEGLVADGHHHLLLDLADLEFIDSTGLTAFICAYRAADQAAAKPAPQCRQRLRPAVARRGGTARTGLHEATLTRAAARHAPRADVRRVERQYVRRMRACATVRGSPIASAAL